MQPSNKPGDPILCSQVSDPESYEPVGMGVAPLPPLYAAAPDLLAALLYVQKNGYEESTDAVDIVAAAIAKATTEPKE